MGRIVWDDEAKDFVEAGPLPVDPPEIRLRRCGFGGWFWEIPMPDSMTMLTIDRMYFTRWGAERAARRAWKRERRDEARRDNPVVIKGDR